ncbi:hypothetical protein N7457_006458, partial [Penicillium paradoxum]|uniref:uncharacterized protein n=1 Tax=Penicillium paradoxum TaxID=176176 RepID=UPI0025468C30
MVEGDFGLISFALIGRRVELDPKGNVKTEDLEHGSRLLWSLSKLQLLRDADWKVAVPKSISISSTQRKLRAIQGQRVGNILQSGDECNHCSMGYGTFHKCVGPSKAAQSTSNEALHHLESKKRKRAIEYDRTYYQSPLELPDFKKDGNFAQKRQALESIHTVYDRVLQDISRLFDSLSKSNELESNAETDDEKRDLVAGEPGVSSESVEATVVPVDTAPRWEGKGGGDLLKYLVAAGKLRYKKEEDQEATAVFTKSRPKKPKLERD